MARDLNQRGLRYRTGVPWSKDLVNNVLAQTAVTGTYWWGKSRRHRVLPPEQWLPLQVEPIVDAQVYALAHQRREQRQPARSPGHTEARPHVFSGLLRCGKCGGTYTRETSGKKVRAGHYQYGYYNCRRSTRIGKEVCAGYRIRTEDLDAAVVERLAQEVCRPERVQALRERMAKRSALASASQRSDEELAGLWRTLLGQEQVLRTYLLHLTERIEVHEHRIVLVPRTGP